MILSPLDRNVSTTTNLACMLVAQPSFAPFSEIPPISQKLMAYRDAGFCHTSCLFYVSNKSTITHFLVECSCGFTIYFIHSLLWWGTNTSHSSIWKSIICCHILIRWKFSHACLHTITANAKARFCFIFSEIPEPITVIGIHICIPICCTKFSVTFYLIPHL